MASKATSQPVPSDCDRCGIKNECCTYFAVMLCADDSCTCRGKGFALPSRVEGCESYRLMVLDEGWEESQKNAQDEIAKPGFTWLEREHFHGAEKP